MFPPFNVVGATVEIVGQNVSGTTNNIGVASLPTNSVAGGPQTIRLTPQSSQLSSAPAGFGSEGANPGDFQFRPLDMSINFSGGQLTSPDPSVTSGVVHGDAFMTSSTQLQVDWKPDWIKCKNTGSRFGKSFQMIVVHRTGDELSPSLNALLNTPRKAPIMSWT